MESSYTKNLGSGLVLEAELLKKYAYDLIGSRNVKNNLQNIFRVYNRIIINGTLAAQRDGEKLILTNSTCATYFQR